MRKIVLFLDIDGVLVPIAGRELYQTRTFHPKCVDAFKEILCILNHPQIVFCTTWRHEPYIQCLYEQFIENGLPIELCIDGTPDLRKDEKRDINQLRGQEILSWLEHHPEVWGCPTDR